MVQKRAIAAKYVFLDVVKFTQMADIEAQSHVIRSLNEIVKESLNIHKIATTKRILLPTGDGICIALLNVLQPHDIHLSISLSILELVSKHNELANDTNRYHIRVGINSATDARVIDVNGRRNVAGRGINMAARIMSVANEGQIFVGRAVYEDLVGWRKYRDAFKPQRVQVKHNIWLDVYRLVSPGHPGLTSRSRRSKQAAVVLSNQKSYRY